MRSSLFLVALPIVVSGIRLDIPEQQPLITEHPPGTIYQVLSSNPRFSRLTKAVDFVDGVAQLLNDSSANLSFFAPPDSALPHHKDDLAPNGLPPVFETYETSYLPGPTDLAEALRMLDNLEKSKSATNGPDDEKRKKILKVILGAILEYHIIPTAAYDIITLGHNSTYPTNLVVPGVLDSQPQRLRVEQTIIPPRTSINLYAKIIKPNVKASNGIIHVVDYPLLPPPSIFQGLYMAPHFFSTLTSALQRSGLTEALDLRYIHHKGFEGSRLVTAFAPTNHAFEALPKKLQLFLFSPFGEKALKKILSYHVVPNVVVHSDYLRAEHSDKKNSPCHEPTLATAAFPLPTEPISSVNLTLKTLFANHTLQAEIVREKITVPFPWPGHKKPYKVHTEVSVNRQPVLVPDIVGLNGAAHVIGKILDPRTCHHLRPVDSPVDEGVWENWEEWLPQWVNESL
ncbi:FAS1 domain-containing protein [Phlegmacium glaucopus]|nr:FAS1 domain-containing protein [Phlegmacium glaucopus]